MLKYQEQNKIIMIFFLYVLAFYFLYRFFEKTFLIFALQKFFILQIITIPRKLFLNKFLQNLILKKNLCYSNSANNLYFFSLKNALFKATRQAPLFKELLCDCFLFLKKWNLNIFSKKLQGFRPIPIQKGFFLIYKLKQVAFQFLGKPIGLRFINKHNIYKFLKLLIIKIIFVVFIIFIFGNTFADTGSVDTPPATTQAQQAQTPAKTDGNKTPTSDKTDNKTANGETSKKTPTGDPSYSEIQKDLGKVLIDVIKVLVYMHWVSVSIIGEFFNPMIIFSPNIKEFLYRIWYSMRDLVNTIIAVLLIVVIGYSLFKSFSIASITTLLKKLVLALVLVNFSWYVTKLIIDVGHIATIAVFSIPQEFAKSSTAMKEGKIIQDTFFLYVPDLKDNVENVSKIKGSRNINNVACEIFLDDTLDSKDSIIAKLKALKTKVKGEVSKTQDPATNKAVGENKTADSVANDARSKREASFQSILSSAEIVLDAFTKDPVLKDIKCFENEDVKIKPNTSMIIFITKKIDDTYKLKSSDLASAISLNFLPTQELLKVSTATQGLSTLMFETIYSMIMVIAISVIFIGLAGFCIERIVMIWAIIMVSPVSALAYVFSDIFTELKPLLPGALISMLLKYSFFIPVKLGLVFSIAFIFMGEFYYTDGISSSVITGPIWFLIYPYFILYFLWKYGFQAIGSQSGTFVGSHVEKIFRNPVEKFAYGTLGNLSYIPIIPGTTGSSATSFADLKSQFTPLENGLFSNYEKEFKDRQASKQNFEEAIRLPSAITPAVLNIQNSNKLLKEDKDNKVKYNEEGFDKFELSLTPQDKTSLTWDSLTPHRKLEIFRQVYTGNKNVAVENKDLQKLVPHIESKEKDQVKFDKFNDYLGTKQSEAKENGADMEIKFGNKYDGDKEALNGKNIKITGFTKDNFNSLVSSNNITSRDQLEKIFVEIMKTPPTQPIDKKAFEKLFKEKKEKNG